MKPRNCRSPWSQKELSLLRTRPVAEVARLTGRTVRAIYYRRSKEGVRANSLKYWSSEDDRLIKTLSVDEFVRRTGRRRYNVLVRRRQLGLPSLRVPRPVPPRHKFHEPRLVVPRGWTAEEDEILRTMPTHEAAKVLGRTISALGSRRFFLRHAQEVRARKRRAKQALQAERRAQLNRLNTERKNP